MGDHGDLRADRDHRQRSRDDEPPADADANTGGLKVVPGVDLTVDASTISGNSVTASAGVGGVTLGGTLEDCTIAGNTVHAEAPRGTAIAFGGGVWVAEEPITMRGSEVRGNVVTARGSAGIARGGGIYDGPNEGNFGPSDLMLFDTRITGNILRASRHIVFLGGGLYLEGARLRMQRSTIAHNEPDDCVGCR